MIKNIFIFLVSLPLSFFSGAVYLIDFSGEVIEKTCEAVMPGGNYTVTLDQVSTGELAQLTAGMYDAVSAPFSVQISDCPSAVSEVGVILNSSGMDHTTGNLTDTAGYGYDNVQIRIMNDAVNPPVQVMVGSNAPDRFIPVRNNGALIPMTAYYYVTGVSSGGIQKGKIQTTAHFSVRTQ